MIFLFPFFFTLLILSAGLAEPPDYADDSTYADFIGRLYVDCASIDVALYQSSSQAVVDRTDAAACFELSSALGQTIIADHNTQVFAALGDVCQGDTACIRRADGTVVSYVCTGVFKGRNTGWDLSDWQGQSVIGRADLIMYTCLSGWQTVWIVLWDEVPASESPANQPLLQVLAHTDHLIAVLLQETTHPLPASRQPEISELTLRSAP